MIVSLVMAISRAQLTRPPVASAARRGSPRPHVARLIPAAGVLLGLAGCSTTGPTHAYLANRAEEPIIDVLPGAADVDVPSHLVPTNELYGIAYDPFTDHLFLRVYPGGFIRVIDRPARSIKRNFLVKDLPPGPGDLAIRSRDRHLFFTHPTLPLVLETNLVGDTVRTITLADLDGPPAGIAYDQKNHRLLILQGGNPARIRTHDLSGNLVETVTLNRDVGLVSLGYDSVAQEFYVPLNDEPAVGIFDARGQLLRTLADAGGKTPRFVDLGQRSLFRMF